MVSLLTAGAQKQLPSPNNGYNRNVSSPKQTKQAWNGRRCEMQEWGRPDIILVLRAGTRVLGFHACASAPSRAPGSKHLDEE